MKKIILLFIAILILSKPVHAQIDLTKYSQSYPTGATDKPSSFGIITAIPEVNNCFWEAYPNVMLRSLLLNDTAFQNGRPKEFVAINTFDTAKAQFFLHGVTPQNAGEYEYKVLNWPNKIIVPWTAITKFTDHHFAATSGWPQMAYLGGYAGALGDRILVDVRKKGSRQITGSSVVAWHSIKPVVAEIYTPDELDIFLKRLARPWDSKPEPGEPSRLRMQESNTVINSNGSPAKFIAGPNENNLVFQLTADIYHKYQLEYQLVRNEEVLIPWKANDFDNGFIWLRDLAPGDYTLNMRYSAQITHITSCPFLIKTPWYQSTWFRLIIGVLWAAFMGFIIFWILLIRQKRKTAIELSNKTKLQLELKAIYAQLNPHFIFNALGSIQGLINKHDIKAANIYLADFAKLMRETLTNSNNDQSSLKQEIVTLDTYLKLEQLRFGFKYEINIDEDISVYETDMPSLLLQPLVENAVKHGISDMGEKGTIALNFTREGHNMVVTLVDNGSGFSINKVTSGFGLKLTNDRIRLLNELTKEQSILFEIKGNSPSGTKIYLIFKNWFL